MSKLVSGFFVPKRSSTQQQRLCARLATGSLIVCTVLTKFKELPEGSTVVDISPHGASHWTHSARIRTNDQKGEEVSYFLKVGTRRSFGF